jgi:hypothetical protein
MGTNVGCTIQVTHGRRGTFMPVTAGSPDPEHDDLSGVLRDIGLGMMARTRARLANTPETREFLELGLNLLREDLIEHTGPDFDNGKRSRLFESVSRERILQLAAAADVEQIRLLSVNMFRHRWDRKDRYTEDLISYMFRLAPQKRHLDLMDATSEKLITQMDIGDFIRTMADYELTTMIEDPTADLQAIVQNAMPNHPRVREFCQAQLDHLLPRWAQLYKNVAAAYGLELRPGRSWLDVAIMFNALIEGELAWTRVGGRRKLSNGESVLASTILAMLPSLMSGPGIPNLR